MIDLNKLKKSLDDHLETVTDHDLKNYMKMKDSELPLNHDKLIKEGYVRMPNGSYYRKNDPRTSIEAKTLFWYYHNEGNADLKVVKLSDHEEEVKRLKTEISIEGDRIAELELKESRLKNLLERASYYLPEKALTDSLPGLKYEIHKAINDIEVLEPPYSDLIDPEY